MRESDMGDSDAPAATADVASSVVPLPPTTDRAPALPLDSDAAPDPELASPFLTANEPRTGRISQPEEETAPLPPTSVLAAGERESARSPSTAPAGDPLSIGEISLTEVLGLQDLPEESQAELVAHAQIEALDTDEEVSAFAVALVLQGSVNIMPTVADAACARANRGEVVFTAGTLEERIGLRVVAAVDGTRVAVWQQAELDAATAACPWVADELRLVADRYQALAGACVGPMGERLDDALRSMVTSRCRVQHVMPGEVLVEAGQPLPGLFIVGSGRVEIVGADGEVRDELGSGDFVFAVEVLGAGPAPASARAGVGGALVLFAERRAAHELMVVVPPLLEILAG